jgi:hypothetical protein
MHIVARAEGAVAATVMRRFVSSLAKRRDGRIIGT